MNKGEPENALGLFDEARQKEPGQAEYHAAAGDALMAMERAEEAEKAYRETIKLSAQTPEYMFRLGQALWAQGHRDKAEKTLIAGLSYDTDENQPEIRIALSKLLIEKAEHLLTDISQMTSNFVEIVPRPHLQGNCIPFAAIR